MQVGQGGMVERQSEGGGNCWVSLGSTRGDGDVRGRAGGVHVGSGKGALQLRMRYSGWGAACMDSLQGERMQVGWVACGPPKDAC